MATTSAKTYDSSGLLSTVSYGIEGAAALGGAYAQYTALRAQGDFQVAMAGINQQFADIQANDVINQGNAQANQIRKHGESTVGSERAAAAAQGIDVNDSQGSAAAAIDDTKLMEAQDVATARSNAWKTAWGIRTQATLGVDSARFNQSGENFAANQTLLTGGLKALGAGLQASGIYAKSKGSTAADSSSTNPATAIKSSADGFGWYPDPGKESQGPGFFGRGPRADYGYQASDWWQSGGGK